VESLLDRPVAASPDRPPAEPAGPIGAAWLGRIAYRDAWRLQKALAAARADGRIGDQLLLLEHPPVLTIGRRGDPAHVLAAPEVLAARGIEVLDVERGGEVTYHGPGQLVAYPILALSRRGLLLRPLVRALEAAMIATCEALGVVAGRRDGHPGCWCDKDGPAPRKIGALGLRVERGVSYHGIALNVAPNLADFELIDPCGLPGVLSTSISAELGRDDAPSTGVVAAAAAIFALALGERLGAELVGDDPSTGDPVATRAALERLVELDLARLASAV
jgi:lipoyl(octanoyl) transferase